MKRVLLVTILTILINPAFSQKYGEVGLFVGGSYFLGDVTTNLNENTHLAWGATYRQNFNTRWALNFFGRYAPLSGNDQNALADFELQRNLSFQNNVIEFGATVEFNFLDFRPFKPQSFFQVADVFTPYIFVGVSMFSHNPKAELAGNIYALRPLQTEQESYSKVVLALPFGMGMKFRLTDRMILGVSGEFRLAATDYLDDVSGRYPENPNDLSKVGRDLSNRSLEAQGEGHSWGAQRGDQNNNDWFSYAGFTLTYNLKRNPSSCHFNPSK